MTTALPPHEVLYSIGICIPHSSLRVKSFAGVQSSLSALNLHFLTVDWSTSVWKFQFPAAESRSCTASSELAQQYNSVLLQNDEIVHNLVDLGRPTDIHVSMFRVIL